MDGRRLSGCRVVGFQGEWGWWVGGLKERKRGAAIVAEVVHALAEVIDGSGQATVGALGDEALTDRRQEVPAATTIVGQALEVGAEGLGGTAELAVVEECAGRIEGGAAAAASGIGAPAVGQEGREFEAAVVTAVGRIFDF